MDGETGRMDPEGVLIQKLEMRYVVVVDLVYRQVWQDRRMKSSEHVRRKHFCLLPNTNHMPLLEAKLPSVGRSVGWYAIISKKDGKFQFHAPIRALFIFRNSKDSLQTKNENLHSRIELYGR